LYVEQETVLVQQGSMLLLDVDEGVDVDMDMDVDVDVDVDMDVDVDVDVDVMGALVGEEEDTDVEVADTQGA
jgi:hypothetical protein